MMLPITLELFKKYLKGIERRHELQNGLTDLLINYNKDMKDISEIIFPDGESDILELLSVILDDENDWIGYWVYELECGKKYHDGCVTEEIDGKKVNVPLKTAEDLWNLLISFRD